MATLNEFLNRQRAAKAAETKTEPKLIKPAPVIMGFTTQQKKDGK